MGIPRNIGRRELLLHIGRAAFAGQFALTPCATARAQVSRPSMDEPIKLPPPAGEGTMSVESALGTRRSVREFKEATEGAVGALVDAVRFGRHLYLSVPPPGGGTGNQKPQIQQVGLRLWQ